MIKVVKLQREPKQMKNKQWKQGILVDTGYVQRWIQVIIPKDLNIFNDYKEGDEIKIIEEGVNLNAEKPIFIDLTMIQKPGVPNPVGPPDEEEPASSGEEDIFEHMAMFNNKKDCAKELLSMFNDTCPEWFKQQGPASATFNDIVRKLL